MSYWSSSSEQQANFDRLNASGGLSQILKILAPNGTSGLSNEQAEQLAGTINLLVTDPLMILGLPEIIQKASGGDPAAMVQVVTLATRLKLFGSGAGGSTVGGSVNEIPGDWKRVSGAGATINTPKGFASYVTSHGDIVHVSPAGLIYGYDKTFVNRIDHVLAHTQPDITKPTHTVFNARGDNVLALVDEAWAKRGVSVPGDPGAFVVPMGRDIGTNGERNLRIIVAVENNVATNKIISAYPQ
ncbi:hypothetical protein [Agrobacterium sp. LMR679]|uniref:hypothetical protein n=1 Tax=Agrobacterium sp. LMR679 TaxID=3014335 RepID=UPI0022AEF332|nr:hypothetical protein [Agrobacterium sp. LMR679]MCZ4074971.1 hypothetical protein [Agrobacterium sp. LMR679]